MLLSRKSEINSHNVWWFKAQFLVLSHWEIIIIAILSHPIPPSSQLVQWSYGWCVPAELVLLCSRADRVGDIPVSWFVGNERGQCKSLIFSCPLLKVLTPTLIGFNLKALYFMFHRKRSRSISSDSDTDLFGRDVSRRFMSKDERDKAEEMERQRKMWVCFNLNMAMRMKVSWPNTNHSIGTTQLTALGP